MTLFLFCCGYSRIIYTLSLHDALPIFRRAADAGDRLKVAIRVPLDLRIQRRINRERRARYEKRVAVGDRKSTRLNSSHANISYAVFSLKKKHRQRATCAHIQPQYEPVP